MSEAGKGSVAEQIVRLLSACGADLLFLHPGTDTAPFQEAISLLRQRGQPTPRVITSTFESVGLAAAHGYWQVSGRPQCVMVHVDVGTQNLGAMMHNALRDRAGVVIIAGRTPYSERGDVLGGRSGAIHWLQDVPDQAGIVRGYAKWTQELARPETAPTVIGRAFQVAASSPAGPTYVMVARDVLMEPATAADEEALRMPVPAPAGLSPEVLGQITELFEAAETPVILTGRIGRDPDAARTLTALARTIGAVVVDRGEAVNVATADRSRLLSAQGGEATLREADLIVIVECDVPWIPAQFTPGSDTQVVHIDPDPVKVTMPLWAFPVDLAAQASGAVAVTQLLGEMERRADADSSLADRWTRRHECLSASDDLSSPKRQSSSISDDGALAIGDVVAALSAVMRDDDILVQEAVTNSAALIAGLGRTEPGSVFSSSGSGLGWALGASVGIKLAAPDRRVITVVGDGSFMFGVPTAALMLAAEAGAPFLTIVLDNDGYQASRRPVWQLYPTGASVARGHVPGTTFERPLDIALLAASCGAHGERVGSRTELEQALRRALDVVESGVAAIVHVAVMAPSPARPAEAAIVTG